MSQFEKVLDFAFLVVGPCLGVYSIISIVQTGRFIRRSIDATGEVVRLERSLGRYGYVYAPVFTFTSVGGEMHTVTSDVATSPAAFDVGDSVTVRYDPEDLRTARIASFFQTWGTSLLSLAIGTAFTFWGCKAFGFL